MLLLLLSWLWWSSTDGPVLVLKNGKQIPCTAYEQKNGKVMIQRGGESFSLPSGVIDWTKTKALAQKRATAAKKEHTPKKRKARPRIDIMGGQTTVKQKAGPIVLTDDKLPKRTASRSPLAVAAGSTTGSSTGSVTIAYRTLANSIIVDATLNGQGPFPFVLDTGAAITVIDPKVLTKVRAEPTGQHVNLVGVGNQSVATKVWRTQGVSLGGAAVQNMDVVGQAIGVINQHGVVGLLGQDFLNHFVTQTNPQSQTITLTAHGKTGATTPSPVATASAENAEQARTAVSTLQDLVLPVRDFTKTYVNQPQPNQQGVAMAQNYLARLVSAKKDLNTYCDQQNRQPAANPQFAACCAKFLRLVQAMERHLEQLRTNLQGGSGDVRATWNQVVAANETLRGCQ